MTRFKPFLKPTLHKELAKYMDGDTIMPINIEISLTGLCNASCTWCFYKDEKTRTNIDTRALERTLTEMLILGVKAITWTGGGEPTMHPEFSEIVEKTAKLGIKQGLITNALKEIDYNPTLFEWIRVSKTNLPINEKHVQKLRKCKTLGIAINYNGNNDEIEEALRIGESAKVDYVQVRPILHRNGPVNVEMPKIKHPLLIISDYKFEDAKMKHGYEKCEAFHFTPFIWENGDVDVCGYMRNNSKYNLGNIYEEFLVDIMDRAPKSVPVCDECQVCCKPHELNKLIHVLKKIEDKDFI